MKICTIFKSILVYLLLCYGKNVAFAAQPGQGGQGSQGSSPPDGKKQYLLTEVDISEKESTDEIIYRVEFDDTLTFTCKPRYLIRKVTKRDKLIWEHESGPYPNRVYLVPDPQGRGGRLANIRFPGDEVKVIVDVKVKATDDKVVYFKESDDVELFICRTGFLIERVVSGQHVLYQHNPGDDHPNRVIVSRDEQGKRMANVRFPGDELLLVTLDVAIRQSTPEVEFYVNKDGLDVFVPRPGYSIEKVVKSGKHIYQFEEGFYPESVTIFYDDRGKPIARFRFRDEEEVPPPPKPKPPVEKREGISLNIATKESGYGFDYSSEDNVGTFVANKNVAFNSISNNNDLIWSNKNPNEFATRVLRDGIKSCKSLKNITLYLVNGTFKHLAYSEKRWRTVHNKILINIANKNNIHVNYSEEYDLGIFTPKHDCIFSMVTLSRSCGCGRRVSDTTFWTAPDDKTFSRQVITNYHFGTQRKKYVTLFLSDGNILHYFSPKRTRSWSRLSNKIQLNIAKNDSRYEFYYAGYDQLPTYVANHNFVFTQVVQGVNHIWASQNNKHANLVFTDNEIDSKRSHLLIVLSDGARLYFKKSGSSWSKGNADDFPGFTLDLAETYTTTTIDYAENESGDSKSFTTKNGFLISKLMDFDTDSEVWSANKRSEFLRKVIVIKDDLILKPKVGSRIEFKREGRKWIRQTSK